MSISLSVESMEVLHTAVRLGVGRIGVVPPSMVAPRLVPLLDRRCEADCSVAGGVPVPGEVCPGDLLALPAAGA
ncbi:hypothetical protein ACWHA1_39845 [Streptomyces decoyicus]